LPRTVAPSLEALRLGARKPYDLRFEWVATENLPAKANPAN
jgi:hypothetical protein